VWATRDYKTYLYGTLKRAPATVNAALAVLSDLAIRRGLGKLDGNQIARLDLDDLPTTQRRPRLSISNLFLVREVLMAALLRSRDRRMAGSQLGE